MAQGPLCYNPLTMSSRAPFDLRPSAIAGAWYPGDASVLAASIDQMLADSQPVLLDGDVVALVVTHAGHRYSGPVAACAFQTLRTLEPEIVAVLSPLHQPHPARLLTSGHQAYWTPLGPVPVAEELLTQLQADLAEEANLRLEPVLEDREHSLEIELPFLQRVIETPFLLLPIMIRDQSKAVAEALGHALGRVLAHHRSILIASTDLSHFYPADVARRLDTEMLTRLAALDPVALLSAEEEGVGFACGRAAAAAAIWAARDLGADAARVLCYANSGDITGDRSSVVGYGAAALTRAASV
jgi:AmmeMemoRadiSam system protein B